VSAGTRVLDHLHDEVTELLRRHDNRYTSGRRRLVEVLVAAERPLTLPEILDTDTALTQSSAYRNLDVLETSGAIRRIVGTGDHAHFELAESMLGHHHHLICVGCGVIEDIRLGDTLEQAVDSALTTAALDAGFTPLHHSLDLHGHCASCS
jgi:Fur family transcriptional regulator, ferric uptake regulator